MVTHRLQAKRRTGSVHRQRPAFYPLCYATNQQWLKRAYAQLLIKPADVQTELITFDVKSRSRRLEVSGVVIGGAGLTEYESVVVTRRAAQRAELDREIVAP